MIKRFTVISLLCVAVCCILRAESNKELEEAQVSGARACFNVVVVDDAGMPVGGAGVHARLGMNFGKATLVEGVTSREGKVKVEGVTTGYEIVIEIDKAGYYLSKHKLCLNSQEKDKLYEIKKGKWYPWGRDVVVKVCKIDCPVNLIRIAKTLAVPATNVWMGVDLKLGDWVKPYGKGVDVDLETRVLWDGRSPFYSRYCKTEVRFPVKMSGAYKVENLSDSLMPFPKVADTNAVYESSFEYYDRKDSPRLRASLLPNDSRVLRVRCVVSKDGALRSANYCSLRCLEATPGNNGGKAVMSIECGFNPVANDINLEDAYLVRQSQMRKVHAEKARLEKERNKSSVLGGIKKMFGTP